MTERVIVGKDLFDLIGAHATYESNGTLKNPDFSVSLLLEEIVLRVRRLSIQRETTPDEVVLNGDDIVDLKEGAESYVEGSGMLAGGGPIGEAIKNKTEQVIAAMAKLIPIENPLDATWAQEA